MCTGTLNIPVMSEVFSRGDDVEHLGSQRQARDHVTQSHPWIGRCGKVILLDLIMMQHELHVSEQSNIPQIANEDYV